MGGWLGAGYERNVGGRFQVPSCCPCHMGSILPQQKPRELAWPLSPKSLRRQNRKTTQNGWLAWSRLRGSNSLPPPWQGGALPDELNLRFSQRCLLYRTGRLLSRAFSKKEKPPNLSGLYWSRLRAKHRRRFQVPSCCPCRIGSILPQQKPRELASPLSPKFLRRQNRKATQKRVASLEQVTRLELATSTLARWRSTR